MGDRTLSPAPAPAPAVQQEPSTANNDVPVKVKEESPNPISPSASIARDSEAPSVSPSRGTRHRSVAQRRAYLRDDPLAQDAEPHRVRCRACQKWIKLASNAEYNPSNWEQHKLRCRGSSRPATRRTPSKPNFGPNSRVATAERKIVLLNDPQVKEFSQGQVQCGTCKTVVALEGEVQYDLTRWTEHKTTCIPVVPAPITPKPRAFPPHSTSSTHSQVSATRSVRSPTPADQGSNSHPPGSTAATSSSPAAVKVGVKRARENEEEEPLANRPRTEVYAPPEKDEPSLFGWLMQPLKEFARGFREGLEST